jgi:hypothetical protein
MDRLALVELEVSAHVNGPPQLVWMVLCSFPEASNDRGVATRSVCEVRRNPHQQKYSHVKSLPVISVKFEGGIMGRGTLFPLSAFGAGVFVLAR